MKQVKKKSTVREYYEALLIAVIFVNFAWTFVAKNFKIPSASMVDNLLIGDHLVVNKFAYGPAESRLLTRIFPFREIQRGDIVVFRYPVDPDLDFVKRVIALPGDTIEIRDKHVYINGAMTEEKYTVFSDPVIIPDRPLMPMKQRDQFGPITIPRGEYFMMGDNRDNSSDSRFWGTVPRGMIKGRAFMVYWSFEGEGLANVVLHFFSGTRWDRMFFIVDSKHHFHADRNEGAYSE